MEVVFFQMLFRWWYCFVIWVYDLNTAVPLVADNLCSAGSPLQCHVRRHCHRKNKAKLGCYAILHATFADYIRLNISHHHYRSLFFLWIFYDVWKHQSCGMKCCVFLIFLMTVLRCVTLREQPYQTQNFG